MTHEVQGAIQKFLYHLSCEDYAKADVEIKNAIKLKVENAYNQAYAKVEADSKKK